MPVRGGLSDVVSDVGVRELQELVSQAVVTEVGGTGHMVTGNDNDDLATAMLGFVGRY